MAVRHAVESTHRPAPVLHSLDRGAVAQVIGPDGAPSASVSRHLEPGAGTGEQPSLVAVVTVTGDVDRDTAPLIEQVLLQTIDHRPRTCIDLGHVDFFGADGIHLLMSAYQRAADRGHSLVARGVHGVTERVFGIAGLDTLFVSAD